MFSAELSQAGVALRPKMPRRLFSLFLLFLLLASCVFVHTRAAGGRRRKRVGFLSSWDCPRPGDDEAAEYMKTRGGAAAEYMKTREHIAAWGTGEIEDDPSILPPEKNETKEPNVFERRKSVTVLKDNKAYRLALKNESSGRVLAAQQDGFLHLLVGDIKKRPATHILWKGPASLNAALVDAFQRKELSVQSHHFSSFLTESRKIGFVVGVEKKMSERGFAIIHLKEQGLEVSFVEKDKNCSSYVFLGWKEKVTMLAYCRNGTHIMRESADMGRTWGDADGPLLRLWGTFKDKEDFTTVTIDNKPLLLYTETKDTQTNTEKHAIHLWFSDGSRAHDVGLIVADENPLISSGLLYTNGEFLSLHQRLIDGFNRHFFVSFNRQVETIRSLLKTWAENDAYLLKSCDETAPEDATSKTFCMTPVPTDGLVGFLSDKGSDATIWQDKYRFVNATVKSGTKVKNGYTFRGDNSGALWPVGHEPQSVWYSFERSGFAIVATVTIHEVPNTDAPLLTFDGNEENKRSGLSYGSDKQWRLLYTGIKVDHNKTWEANRTYRVALVLLKNTLSAYVDGSLVGGFGFYGPAEEPLKLQNLFIGGYEGSRSRRNVKTVSHVTVADVSLYNRPLDGSEIEELCMTVSARRSKEVKRTAKQEKRPVNVAPPRDSWKQTPGPRNNVTEKKTPAAAPTRPIGPGDGSAYPRVGALPLLLLGFWRFLPLR